MSISADTFFFFTLLLQNIAPLRLSPPVLVSDINVVMCDVPEHLDGGKEGSVNTELLLIDC